MGICAVSNFLYHFIGTSVVVATKKGYLKREYTILEPKVAISHHRSDDHHAVLSTNWPMWRIAIS